MPANTAPPHQPGAQKEYLLSSQQGWKEKGKMALEIWDALPKWRTARQ